MPKHDFSGKEWKEGEKITIESKEHYDKLISDGYEITDKNITMKKIKGARDEFSTNFYLRMKKDEKIFIANANSIGDYALCLVPLYDFDKKKLVFMWAPDGNLYAEFEKTFVDILMSDHNRPIITKQLVSSKPKNIQNLFSQWIEEEKHNMLSNKNSEIYYDICCVNEKNGNIEKKMYSKKNLTLDNIYTLVSEAKGFDQSYCLSFFYLTKKFKNITNNDDVIIGMILLDLKQKETICFNIESGAKFYTDKVRDVKLRSFNIILELFNKSFDEKMNCFSFLPLPLDSSWYTSLPWFCYAVLAPLSFDDNESIDKLNRNISIPMFFTFGNSSFIKEGYSFDFRPFSSEQNGAAICILNFNKSDNNITYNLRFDQSKGEPLVHSDYGFHDSKEIKLISHRPLDIEKVFEFNHDLYVAIIAAGTFDSYFSTIIENGIKGIKDAITKNPTLLYPLKWIWIIDKAIKWLNENTDGYKILKKLSENNPLDTDEKNFVMKMIKDHVNLVAEDEECNFAGLNRIGYIVLERYRRGQKKTSLV